MLLRLWWRFAVLVFMVPLVPLLVAGHHPEDGGDGGGSGLGGAIVAIGFGAVVFAIVGFFIVLQVRKRMRRLQKRRRR